MALLQAPDPAEATPSVTLRVQCLSLPTPLSFGAFSICVGTLFWCLVAKTSLARQEGGV